MSDQAGRYKDIGGIELYYEFMGANHDGPTLVFDSGYAWSLKNWNSIKVSVSKFAKVVVYDRAGIGKSEIDGRKQDSKQAVENLHLLLENANIKPPYVLIGHSYGGVNVRLFTATYSDEVSGVILLDSCHEDQNEKMAPFFTDEVREGYYKGFQYEGSLNQFEESLEQVRTVTSFGDLPLMVITGGTQPHHTPESFKAWMSFQEDLARLSTNSRHIIVEDSGHSIHIDEPEKVVEIIEDMFQILK